MWIIDEFKFLAVKNNIKAEKEKPTKKYKKIIMIFQKMVMNYKKIKK